MISAKIALLFVCCTVGVYASYIEHGKHGYSVKVIHDEHHHGGHHHGGGGGWEGGAAGGAYGDGGHHHGGYAGVVVHHGGGGHDDGHDGGHGGHEDYHAYPKYKFDYGVHDHHTGDNKKQWEERDGDFVKGGYQFHEADGTTRVVEYTSDKHNGFNAIVKNIGHAHHPQVYAKHYDHGHHDVGHHGGATSYNSLHQDHHHGHHY